MLNPIAWLRAKRLVRKDRQKRWAIAIAPDPADPLGFAPVVRLLERELTSAVEAAGFHLHNRAVATATSDKWISFDIAGTDLKVWLGPFQSEVTRPGLEVRLEAVDFKTPEAYSATIVARTVAALKTRAPIT
jgi:hypothetical protein